MTVGVYAYGTSAYGRGRYGGDTPASIVVEDAGVGFAALLGNDRYQVIALTADGTDDTTPEMRYWFAMPPEWGELLAAKRKEQLVKFYATAENGGRVEGDVELPEQHITKGMEATVAGVLVEFTPRPWAVGTFDGGLAENDEIGFSVYVEGFHMPDLVTLVPSANRQSGYIRSETLDFVITAAEVDATYWPNRMAVFLPCRLLQHVRSVRCGVKTMHHCQVRSVEVYGALLPSRLG